MTLIECVPNFSEGRRLDVVDEIVVGIASVAGVQVLDRQSDATHNRSVVTFVGDEEAAVEAAFRGIAAAARLIDLNLHSGAHPRFSAADVVPFVPLQAEDMECCVRAAETLAARVWSELEVPVYLYEECARSDARRDLALVRGAGFEDLRANIATDSTRAPDVGLPRIHPTAGAVAIGARPPLIAFNVDLASNDLDLAKDIAAAIRERGGGLPHLKALGLATDAGVQVSMNLTDFRVTSPAAAFAAVETRAREAGVAVVSSEFIGLIPMEALTALAGEALQHATLAPAQVIESRLLQLMRARSDGSPGA